MGWFNSGVPWKMRNSSGTLSLGDRVCAVLVDKTPQLEFRLPATASNPWDNTNYPNDIWVINTDAVGADPVRIQPPAGGYIATGGASLGKDTPLQLQDGQMVVLVPFLKNAYVAVVS